MMAIFAAAQIPGPLTTSPNWAYEGCFSAPPGHLLDWFTPQNLSATGVETCLKACTSRYTGLGAGLVPIYPI